MNDNENTRDIAKRESTEKQSRSVLPKNNHLLIIAIDEYEHGVPALSNPVRDALKFKEILIKKYQFKEENVIALLNKEATKRNIFKIFDDLLKKLDSEDNLIIYFSGHGELVDRTQEDQAYWIPADATANERYTYLDTDEVRKFFKNLNAHHVFGIIDCCFSGSLVLKNISHATHRYYSKPSRWVLTSGVKEPVPDGTGIHSPFAASLITTLKTNEADDLSIAKLWLESREGIAANSYQTPLCQPLSDAGHQGGEFYFLKKEVTILPDRLFKDSNTKNVKPDSPKQKITDLSGLKKYLNKKAITDLGGLLDLLFDIVADHSYSKRTIITRSGGYHNLKKDIDDGVIRESDKRVALAQITSAITSIINELEKEDFVENVFEQVNR